uniref:Actin-binding Rho-activating protein n=1 Tax=Eptatretus burgeri TaxID=7764 RepID=A0A8C4WYR1_EPTBU
MTPPFLKHTNMQPPTTSPIPTHFEPILSSSDEATDHSGKQSSAPSGWTPGGPNDDVSTVWDQRHISDKSEAPDVHVEDTISEQCSIIRCSANSIKVPAANVVVKRRDREVIGFLASRFEQSEDLDETESPAKDKLSPLTSNQSPTRRRRCSGIVSELAQPAVFIKRPSLQRSEEHTDRQKLNPFSEDFDYDYAMSTRLQKGQDGYGSPAEGTVTAERGKRASRHIRREMEDLCLIIASMGERGPNTVEITFGRLFERYVRISDKVVGILLRARKHGMVEFEGEMLWQGRDDDKIITLIQ